MPRSRRVVCTINLQIADVVESVAHGGRQRERKPRLADYSATAFAGQGYVGAGLARLRARLMVSIMVADAGAMVAAILAPAA